MDTFKAAFVTLLESQISLPADQLAAMVGAPPSADMGDFSFPCFRLAKTFRKKPDLIASDIASALQAELKAGGMLEKIIAAGGYVNAFVNRAAFIRSVTQKVLDAGDSYGDSDDGAGKTIILDFSSPNLAKPFHIGHLVTTILGASLARMFESRGYRVVRINHLGDWGVQNGYQVLAWNRFGDAEKLERDGIAFLCDLYVSVNRAAQRQARACDALKKHLPDLGLAGEFNADGMNETLAEKLHGFNLDGATGSTLYRLAICEDAVREFNAVWAEWGCDIDAEARAIFKRCEAGDEQTLSVWKLFRDVTLKELGISYKRLHVHFDDTRGESFFAMEKTPDGKTYTQAIIDELIEKDLAEESLGALVVRLPDEKKHKLPPVIIRKGDDATIYTTRDLAAAKWRHEHYQFHKNIYVTDYRQELHFRSFFTVLKMAGYDWADDCEFVPYGLMKIRESDTGKALSMTTRGGEMIPLKELLDRMVQVVRDIVEQGNPNLKDKEAVCEAVGVGAVVFWAQSHGRMRDSVFDWEEATRPNGDTGPYLQYAHARMCSLWRKAQAEYAVIEKDVLAAGVADVLESAEELALAKKISDYPNALASAIADREPFGLARYLLDLAAMYSVFWKERRVLGQEDAVQNARLALSLAVRIVMRKGLRLLGLATPEEM